MGKQREFLWKKVEKICFIKEKGCGKDINKIQLANRNAFCL